METDRQTDRRTDRLTDTPNAAGQFRKEQLGSHWNGFREILLLHFYCNLSSKFKFCQNRMKIKITGTLHEDPRTFMVSVVSSVTMTTVESDILQ